VTDERGPDGRTAWDDPETQAFLRPKKTAAWVLAGFVVLVAAFAIGNGVVQNLHADRIERHGIHTNGVVEWLHDDECSSPRGPVSFEAGVRFTVGETTSVHRFRAQCGQDLFKGAVVPIVYARDNPGDFTVAGRTANVPAVDAALVLFGAMAFAGAIVATGFFFERLRRKHLLQETPWTLTTCLFVPVDADNRSRPGVGTLLVTPSGWKAFRGSDPNHRVITNEPIQDLELAGSVEMLRAVRRPGGRPFVLLTPRMPAKVEAEIREKWMAAQAQ
jgi:hypothetical protein